MDIGIFTFEPTVDDVVARARKAGEQGFGSVWMPQIFGLDAITAAAVLGRETERIELGTAVVPTYPRHPTALADTFWSLFSGVVLWLTSKRLINQEKDYLKQTLELAFEVFARGIKKTLG